MNNKKGFTLIELLAIIVILAIIAVITVPIILNVIEKSKKGAMINSAYGYVNAVNKFYVSSAMENVNNTLSDGRYTVSQIKELGMVVSGIEPIDGWVQLVEGNVVAYSLNFDGYSVDKASDGTEVVTQTNGGSSNQSNGGSESGSGSPTSLNRCPSSMSSATSSLISSLGAVKKGDGAYYILGNGVEIYYNPVTDSACSSGDSGCMHWYLYSIKNGYVNMVLDHNISEAKSQDGVWANKIDYTAGLTPIMNGNEVVGYEVGEGEGSKAVSAGITYPDTVTSFPTWYYDYREQSPGGGVSAFPITGGESNTARGPVTALNYLKTNTSTWTTDTPMVPNFRCLDEYIIPFSSNHGKYQINYTGYHARLITYGELNYMGCTSSLNSCPSWLRKGTAGEDNTIYSTIYGYWTSTLNIETGAYAMYRSSFHDSSVYGNSESDGNDYYGIRPVITVSIEDIINQLS